MTLQPGLYEQAQTIESVWLDANQDWDIDFEAVVISYGHDLGTLTRRPFAVLLTFLTMAFQGGRVVEIVICRNNNLDNIDSIALNAQVTFRGLTIPDTEISTSAADAYRHIDITSFLAQESVKPRAKLTHQIQCLR